MVDDHDARGFIDLIFDELPVNEMSQRAREFYEQMDMRRYSSFFQQRCLTGTD